MPDHPVLIAGAGIGGLTLALALSRRGRDVVILERRTRLEEEGAGIQLSPNASRVLIDLGLGKPLSRIAGEPRRLSVRNGRSGDVLASAPLGDAMRERYGAPYCVVHRADLQLLLLDAVRAATHVRLHFGREVDGVSQEATSVVVSTSSATGMEKLRGSALVGADGLRSRTAVLLGDAGKPEFRGYAAWRGTLPPDAAPAGISRSETGLWLGPGAHLVHYPIKAGRMINVVAVVQSPIGDPDWSREGDADVVGARFKTWAAPVRELLQAVDRWRVWSLFDRPARKHWCDGRVGLLGDAAHPVLPFLAQGGALAIEDAAVLAARLTQSNDVAAAFRTYEAERKPRTRRVQEAARANGRTYHLGFPFAAARDLVIRRAGEKLTDRYDWLYGWTPPAGP